MTVGVLKEIKPQEGRVALLPRHVGALTQSGERVLVERGAGASSGAADADYEEAGAELRDAAAPIWAEADFIVKVKEVLPQEYDFLRPGHLILTNLHTAANREETDRLLAAGLTAIAAEDTHRFGSPNCALAGEIGAFEGVRLCLGPQGGPGRHFFGHYGAPPIRAVVIGLGNVGRGALRTLLSLGCRTTGLDVVWGARYRAEQDHPTPLFDTGPVEDLPDLLGDADLIVNCVLWPKHRDDHLIGRADLARLKPGAVICDIACDEGGAIETSRPTSWADPVYAVDGVRHFCVDNIPGAAPVAASAGYGDALMRHIEQILTHGWREACRRDDFLRRGLVCAGGLLLHEETARVQSRERASPEAVLGASEG
ncbi:MAG: NAD(P)-dependent oxidoreductase [Marivibrio sp.]|uniref:alanine dehydrogenase n=1 Tax=Marivibrio sp. TaxID=2039719 RepID=UPI0032EB5EB2